MPKKSLTLHYLLLETKSPVLPHKQLCELEVVSLGQFTKDCFHRLRTCFRYCIVEQEIRDIVSSQKGLLLLKDSMKTVINRK